MKEATGRIQASKRVFQCLKMNCAVQWHSPNFLRQSWILHVFKKFFKWLFKAEMPQKQSNTNFPPIFTKSLENWLYLLCLSKQYFRWFCRWKERRNENAFWGLPKRGKRRPWKHNFCQNKIFSLIGSSFWTVMFSTFFFFLIQKSKK